MARSLLALPAAGRARPVADRRSDAHSNGATRSGAACSLHGQVIYELHIGTFTPEGTFDAAIAQAPVPARARHHDARGDAGGAVPGPLELGLRRRAAVRAVSLVTAITTGSSASSIARMRSASRSSSTSSTTTSVLTATTCACFSPHYFSTRHKTEWGEALNLDGELRRARAISFSATRATGSASSISTACVWTRRSRSSTTASRTFSRSSPQAAREAAQPRSIVVISENEPQHAQQLLPPERGGFGLDAMWNDDFHHAAKVALTGTRDGYFGDYRGRAQEFVSCVRRGFLYQGQCYPWQKKPRGRPAPGLPAASSIVFLQNHDQVGNTFLGDRVLASCRARPLSRADGADAARPADADAVHGPGVRRVHAFHVLRRSSSRSWPRWCTRAGASSSASSRLRGRTDAAARAADPHDEATFARLEARLARGRAQCRRARFPSRSDPAARVRSRHRAAGPTGIDGATCRSRHSCCAGSTRSMATDCSSSISIASCRDAALRSRCSHRRTARLALLWSSEDPRYGGHGRHDARRSTTVTATGGFRRRARCCWSRAEA